MLREWAWVWEDQCKRKKQNLNGDEKSFKLGLCLELYSAEIKIVLQRKDWRMLIFLKVVGRHPIQVRQYNAHYL